MVTKTTNIIFSNFIRHLESERNAESERITEEMEPNIVGYPSQHGVRKHGGRWNSQPRHVNTIKLRSSST